MTSPATSQRAAIYCRISSDPEGRALGVDRQEQDCRAMAARLGWHVADVFVDNDISASTRSAKPRPRYRDLLDQIDGRQIDAVLVYSTSRLTRRPLEYERWIELVESRGLAIETVASGKVDLATADGRFVARMLAAADAAEAERTSERVARAVRQRAEQGAWHGGRAPYGYRYDPAVRHLVIEEEEASIVREAAARFLRGDSLYAITQALRGGGKRSYQTAGVRIESDWSGRTLRRTLTNPTIAGLRQVGASYVAGDWTPIIGPDDWHRIQSVLTDPARFRARQAPHVTSRKYALSGLLRCARPECEHKPTLTASPGRFTVPEDASAQQYEEARLSNLGWACMPQAGNGCGRVRIKNTELETFVSALALARLDTPEMAEALNQVGSTDEQERLLVQEVQALRQRLDRLEDKYADEEIARATYMRKRAEFTSTITTAEMALRDLTGRASRAHLATGSEARRRWETGDATYHRSVLHALIGHIDVRPHPKGIATRPSSDPAAREALLVERTEIHWLM